jgi:hypothetical protein
MPVQKRTLACSTAARPGIGRSFGSDTPGALLGSR